MADLETGQQYKITGNDLLIGVIDEDDQIIDKIIPVNDIITITDILDDPDEAYFDHVIDGIEYACKIDSVTTHAPGINGTTSILVKVAGGGRRRNRKVRKTRKARKTRKTMKSRKARKSRRSRY